MIRWDQNRDMCHFFFNFCEVLPAAESSELWIHELTCCVHSPRCTHVSVSLSFSCTHTWRHTDTFYDHHLFHSLLTFSLHVSYPCFPHLALVSLCSFSSHCYISSRTLLGMPSLSSLPLYLFWAGLFWRWLIPLTLICHQYWKQASGSPTWPHQSSWRGFQPPGQDKRTNVGVRGGWGISRLKDSKYHLTNGRRLRAGTYLEVIHVVS